MLAGQRVHHRVGDARHRAAVLDAELLGELPDEEGDVLLAVAERRHPEDDGAEAIVEVEPEPSGGDDLPEVLVGGGDQPHVDADRLFAADADDLLLLEHAEEAGLDGRRQVGHLVHEERAAVGQLEPSGVGAGGAGEGAALVAEGSRGRGSRSVAPQFQLTCAGPGGPAETVNLARGELLAGAALPG
jgi:hypothetical protein